MVTPLPLVRNVSGAFSTVSTPKRRRVDTVEVAELLKDTDRQLTEAWKEREERGGLLLD